jgi:hypothetical protein
MGACPCTPTQGHPVAGVEAIRIYVDVMSDSQLPPSSESLPRRSQRPCFISVSKVIVRFCVGGVAEPTIFSYRSDELP